MPLHLRLIFGTITAVLLLIPGLGLYRELAQRNDIWWTPPGMAVSLAESQDRVQIFIRGKALGALLTAGQLRLADEGGAGAVTPADLKFRFNNWDRVRANRLPILLSYAAVLGADLVLLILILTGRLAYRSEQPPVAT